MSGNYRNAIEEAVKMVRDEEKQLKRDFPDDHAISQIADHLTNGYVARVGLGLGEKEAIADAELLKTLRWAADQYFLGRLRSLRQGKE